MTACFTGHRFLSADETPLLTDRLDAALAALLAAGYRRFLCGGALGFDLLAAERVLVLRRSEPSVRLVMVLPCADQTQGWRESDRIRQQQLNALADRVEVLSPAYYEGCMLARNRHMVDRSSACVCYLKHMKGGTMSTAAYAVRTQVPLINLAMEDWEASLPRPVSDLPF